jgi:hypothetical protein
LFVFKSGITHAPDVTMTKLLSSLKSFALAVVYALLLTLLSSFVERVGPELASYGNGCGPSSNQACLEPVLNAGFPFAYIFDRPGESIEKRLIFLQDSLRPLPFALDFFVYFSLVICAFFIRGRRRAKTIQLAAKKRC